MSGVTGNVVIGQPGERANLNAFRFATRRADSSGPGNGLVEIFAIENVISAELLLGLRKGTVRDHGLSFTATNSSGGSRRGKRLRDFEDAMVASLFHNCPVAILRNVMFSR